MRLLAITLLLALTSGAAQAQEVAFGSETNLPVPRFVSIKAAEANVRRGPSLDHRIDWVFQRRHLPVQITAEHGHWRRIRDAEGAGGWVHYSLLSGSRYVLITGERVGLHRRPRADEPLVAVVETGVVARLGECSADWCEVTADGYSGWTAKTSLWGVLPNELRD